MIYWNLIKIAASELTREVAHDPDVLLGEERAGHTPGQGVLC